VLQIVARNCVSRTVPDSQDIDCPTAQLEQDPVLPGSFADVEFAHLNSKFFGFGGKMTPIGVRFEPPDPSQ
jgi:hypothetical protein